MLSVAVGVRGEKEGRENKLQLVMETIKLYSLLPHAVLVLH